MSTTLSIINSQSIVSEIIAPTAQDVFDAIGNLEPGSSLSLFLDGSAATMHPVMIIRGDTEFRIYVETEAAEPA